MAIRTKIKEIVENIDKFEQRIDECGATIFKYKNVEIVSFKAIMEVSIFLDGVDVDNGITITKEEECLLWNTFFAEEGTKEAYKDERLNSISFKEGK